MSAKATNCIISVPSLPTASTLPERATSMRVVSYTHYPTDLIYVAAVKSALSLLDEL
jgi:hypothetical protein